MKLPTHSKLQEYKGMYSDLNKLFEIVSRDSGDILIKFNEDENTKDFNAIQAFLQKVQNEVEGDVPEIKKMDFVTPVNTQKGATFNTIFFVCNDIARRTRQLSYEAIEEYLKKKGIGIKDVRITNGSTSENKHITIKKGNYEGLSLENNLRIIFKGGGKKSSNDFITKDFLKGGEEGGIIEEDKHWVLRKENIATIKKTIINNVKKGVDDKKLTLEGYYIIKTLLDKKDIDNSVISKEECKADPNEEEKYRFSSEKTLSELMADNFTVFTYFGEVLIPWMILNKIPLRDMNGQEVNLIPQTYRDKKKDLDSVREVAFPTDPSNKETDSVIRFNIGNPPIDTDELEDNFKISSKANGGSGCSLFNIFTEDFVVKEDCLLKELYEVYLKYKNISNYQPISIYRMVLKEVLNPKYFSSIENYIPEVYEAFKTNNEKQIRAKLYESIGSERIYDIIKQAFTSDEARERFKDIVTMDIFINQFPVSMTGFCCRYLAKKLNKDEKSMELIKKEFTKDRFYQYHTKVSKTKGIEVEIIEINEENQKNVAAKVETKETLTSNKIGHGALVTRFKKNENE